MSNTQFAALATVQNNYTPAQKTKIFISQAYGLGEAIPEVILDTSAIAIGGTTFTTTALTIDLYEGTRLNFGTEASPKIVYVAEKAEVGDTTVTIEPAQVAVLATDEAIVKAYIPFLGAKSYNLDVQPQEISDASFSDGLYMEKAIASLNTTGSINGVWVYGDPAMEVLFPCMEVGDYIYGEVIYPGRRGGRFFEANVGIAESAERGNMIQRNVNLIITGSIGTLAVNP